METHTQASLNRDLTMRCLDLQNDLALLRHDRDRLILDLYRIAEALGVEEEGFGVTGKGIAPSTILERIAELKGNLNEHRKA